MRNWLVAIFLLSGVGCAKNSLERPETKLSDPMPGSVAWQAYDEGVKRFNNKKYVKGLNAFNKCYEGVRDNPNSSQSDYRVAGLCLKKIGWRYRKLRDYKKAFAYHSMRLHYAEKYGSWFDIHDSIISLDLDAYYLKDLQLSEILLLRTIEDIAPRIVSSPERFKALGVAFNNLSGTQSGLKKFLASVESSKQAVKYWKRYEGQVGTKENKLIHAYKGLGDTYSTWSKALAKQKKDPSQQNASAKQAYSEAIKLALARSASKELVEEMTTYIETLQSK